MPEGLDKLAGAIGDTLKTAPTIYENAALIARGIRAVNLPTS